jgi:hypothetical protein
MSSRSVCRRAALLAPLCLGFIYSAGAAVSLSTSAYTQNFDSMGTSATATLPADFRVDKPAAVRTVGTFAAAATATSLAGGANLSSTAQNGIYNFGSGTGSDRAVGFLSASTGTQSGNLYVQLANNTSGGFSGLQISYGVEKYRHGLNPAGFRIQLFYSTDGVNWTSAGSSFLTSFAADADNTGFTPAPGATVPVSGTLNVAIPANSSFYLAWNYSVASGTTTTNAQALAIDDISITAVNSTSPTNPAGTGAASPASVQASTATLLTVTVTPGTNPASTGLSVTADLTAIGGGASQQFFDDGTHGDVTAGDNIFSFSATVPANTTVGAKTLPVSISDAQSRSGSASIALTVTSLSTPPAGSGSASPNSLQPGGSTLLTVTVTPGTNPASTGLAVTVDLSAIGGISGQQMYDDGTHGDVTPGDSVFSFQASVLGSAGLKTLPATITDAQSRTGNATISLTVQPPMTVKISQVYGGGGNSGTTYKNDFIEIFNASTTAVDLNGWSVQQASATGTSWNVTALCSTPPCLLGPGQYFLAQESPGAGGTTALPTPDATGTASIGATSGKVALVASTTPLTGNCPLGGAVVDLIGYGTGVGGCAEGSAFGELSNTTAAVRKNNGCIDTDNNANDFVEIGPIPRNRTAPANFCGGDPTRISGLGLVSPVSVEPGSLVVMTVRVSPATLPPSTNIGVSADLTAIGGPGAQMFYDDGTHGDATAGDHIFTFQIAVGVQIPFGAKYLVANLTDAQGHTGTAPLTMTVQNPTCGVERWSVKTGTDPDAGLVNLVNPTPATITQLRALTAPADPPGPPANARVLPTEGTLFVVNGTLTLYKKEDDVDYHIVLQDDAGNTIITEIPSPACVGAGSPFAAGVANARAKFDAKLTGTPAFQSANLPVQIKGVGFFDFIHGQTGVAPNGIELHPILDINFTAVTTTTLTSNPNPSQYGQAVAITAKVSTAGTVTPTGKVTLFDNGTLVNTSMLDPSGQTTFNIGNFSSGPHSLSASYEGDSASAPSTSSPLSQAVNKAAQTITFAPPSGRTFGDADFTVTATASSGLPVSFSVNSGPATVAGNVVHLTGAGSVTIRASQNGDTNYNPAPNVDQSFAVAKAGQTITFPPLPDRTYGDVPFTVSATGGASGQPVLFSATGACTVSGNTVTLTTAGGCTVTASQAGDSNYNDAASVPRLFTINKSVQTTVSVTAPPDATFGQAGLAASASGGSGSGAYSYSAGSSTACAVNPATGALTVTAGSGSCAITASRAGDSNYLDSAGSTPAVVSIHKAAATAVVTSSKATTTFGESVTFTATLSGQGGTPTGTVTFRDGAANIGSAPLNGAGQAVLATAALTAGGHSITAVSSGDTNFAAATSAAFGQTVNPAATATVLTSDHNPAALGQAVTLAAQVSLVAPGAGIAGGSVTFRDGSAVLATVPLNAGAAVFSTAALALGPHSITATYNGDGNTVASTSAALPLTVYASTAGGSFVIGDRNAVVGQQVTFWGSQWDKANTLSGGSAPSAFTGFASAVAGGVWTSGGGDSANPPATVPAYMTVIVTSAASKSGSTITGDVVQIVVVQTDPGYEPDPGHTGTGTVVAVVAR